MERVHQYPVVKKLREKNNRWLRKNIDLLLEKLLQMIQRNNFGLSCRGAPMPPQLRP
jgi:hypothetical protein